MTTHELRKIIYVCDFSLNELGAEIEYIVGRQEKIIKFQRSRIEDLLLEMNSVETREELKDYLLSQWDALNIAIRHEYMKSPTYKEAEKVAREKVLKSINQQY